VPLAANPRDFDGYLLDLDGTLYLGPDLIPGADRAVASLRARGARVVFLSNKPIATRRSYARKLTALGIPAAEKDIVNSNLALTRYLCREHRGARLGVIGEQPLLDDLLGAGFEVVDDPVQVDVLVVSWDRQFNYEKLCFGHDALRAGARFVATNPDRVCPMPEGVMLPDCASMVGALEGATGRRVEVWAGKPSRLMGEMALERLGLPAERCAMVGDRLDTDMVLARNNGLASILVLTGCTDRAALAASEQKPDFVLESVAELG